MGVDLQIYLDSMSRDVHSCSHWLRHPATGIFFFFVYFTADSLGFLQKIFFLKNIQHIKYEASVNNLAKQQPLEGVSPAVRTAVLSSAVPAATAAVRSPARVSVSLMALVSTILVTIAIESAAALMVVAAFCPVTPTTRHRNADRQLTSPHALGLVYNWRYWSNGLFVTL
jgi:hypothetical protein